MDYPKDNEILTQMRAIRAKCLDCMCYQPGEVDKCPITVCTLYPYRFGKTPTGYKKVKDITLFIKRIQEGGDGPFIK